MSGFTPGKENSIRQQGTMNPISVFDNFVLWTALSAWVLAQILKTPIHYLRTRKWDWAQLLRAGGMPSSHSALVAAAAHAVGL
jgi:acid phosphatase family membrane protein YuiD